MKKKEEEYGEEKIYYNKWYRTKNVLSIHFCLGHKFEIFFFSFIKERENERIMTSRISEMLVVTKVKTKFQIQSSTKTK